MRHTGVARGRRESRYVQFFRQPWYLAIHGDKQSEEKLGGTKVSCSVSAHVCVSILLTRFVRLTD